jgi:hypothetical protein
VCSAPARREAPSAVVVVDGRVDAADACGNSAAPAHQERRGALGCAFPATAFASGAAADFAFAAVAHVSFRAHALPRAADATSSAANAARAAVGGVLFEIRAAPAALGGRAAAPALALGASLVVATLPPGAPAIVGIDQETWAAAIDASV